jgi:hypothetical protein
MDEHRIPYHNGRPVGGLGLCDKPNRCGMCKLVLNRVASGKQASISKRK